MVPHIRGRGRYGALNLLALRLDCARSAEVPATAASADSGECVGDAPQLSTTPRKGDLGK